MPTQYFELVNEKSSKFWQITTNKDFSIDVQYGRIGATGITKTFYFNTFYIKSI